jgi:PKD repeat protein
MWISKVIFNSIPYSSGASGYSNFTGINFPMTPGASIPLTLTPSYSGSKYNVYWRVWIDYNKDGDFLDAGEQVFAGGPSKSAVSGNFIASSSATGSTRMRVSMKYSSVPTSCETFSYGEVEDYTVTFSTPQPPVANFAANPTTIVEGQTVTFTDQSTNSPSSWAWTFTGGTPAASTAQNPVVTYSTPGNYPVSLTATNAAGSDNETKDNYIHVLDVPSCSSPVNPTDGQANVLVTSNLQWAEVTGATGYNLYFGTNNPPTNLVNGTNLGNVTTYAPSGNLNYSTTYYWKIAPYNANGSAIGCSVWSFSTEASPNTSVQLSYSDFESGTGIWTIGGGDCSRYTGGTYASGGSAAMDIQDNSGVSSSFYLTNGVNVSTPGYVQIDVKFDFIAISMDASEDFWVQYYNGSSWSTVATYSQPTNFSNGTFYQANVSILESAYTFPTNMKIRFMCDASDNNDDVYIDNVIITASTVTSPNNYLIPLTGPQEAITGTNSEGNEAYSIYPNPANNELNINIKGNQVAEVFINDMQGRVVYHGILNNGQAILQLEGFKTGVYSVLLITKDESFKTKFIKR